ncbi:MAG: arylamine N-acetyltransferase [Pseudomonadota bacterium]
MSRQSMDVNQYLQRIHFQGRPAADLATLRQIHHQHLLHIPYENLDVQLGTPLDFDMQRIFTKLVTHNRGGWCYEMNGLMGWALSELGFQVTRMSGAVMRASEGDLQLGNHLLLEVLLEQPYLADVGLGDGLREPIPIRAGEYIQGGLTYRLEHMADGYWRLHNQQFSNVSSFDFKHAPALEDELEAKCQWLQTAPESPFKMLLIAQRFKPESIAVQLGKVSTTITAQGKQSETRETLEELQQHLRDEFDLSVDLSDIWPAIEAAHTRFNTTEPS